MHGLHADRRGPTSPAAGVDPSAAAVEGLAAATEQLVHDVAEDAEVYQQSFPPSCTLSLAAISCRCCSAFMMPCKPLLTLLSPLPEHACCNEKLLSACDGPPDCLSRA